MAARLYWRPGNSCGAAVVCTLPTLIALVPLSKPVAVRAGVTVIDAVAAVVLMALPAPVIAARQAHS